MKAGSKEDLDYTFANFLKAYGLTDQGIHLDHINGRGYMLRYSDYRTVLASDCYRMRGEMCRFLEGLASAARLPKLSEIETARQHPEYVSLCSLAETRGTKSNRKALYQFTMNQVKKNMIGLQDYRDQIAFLLCEKLHPSEIRQAIIGNKSI